MDQHADLGSRLLAMLSYFLSGGLMIGDVMEWLNNNAGAVGAITAILTVFINWYYQRKRSQQ